VPWVQDPVRERRPALFDRLRALEQAYDRAGVPRINSVAHLSQAIKSRALELLRSAGFRAARSLRVDARSGFDGVVDAVGLPFILRADRGHGGPVVLVEERGRFESADWTSLGPAVALEYIETRGEDGLYRKYRYLVTGETGIARHLVIAPEWCVHAEDRLREARHVDEERGFLATPCEQHERMVAAARALGLDFVAFDYGFDRDGELVIWEPNPYPTLWGSFNAEDDYFSYQRDWMDRVFTHVLCFYLNKAGLLSESKGVATHAR
jgi:glutathione synthase/RimK-type ligase-like ATP-grasp enzyme